MNELIDRRALLAGLAGAGAVAAIPARAQLPNWVRQPVTPPPVDYLAVAKKQLAMQARNIPQTDRVGVVDFGLPSSRPRFPPSWRLHRVLPGARTMPSRAPGCDPAEARMQVDADWPTHACSSRSCP